MGSYAWSAERGRNRTKEDCRRASREEFPVGEMSVDTGKIQDAIVVGGGVTVERIMLKSKIHRATLTGANPNYEGSIAVDRDLLTAADILPGEQVHVLNLNNGARLVTYIIEAPAGSGTILLNGPAARLGLTGDIVVLITYAHFTQDELRTYQPRIIHVDSQNRQIHTPSR